MSGKLGADDDASPVPYMFPLPEVLAASLSLGNNAVSHLDEDGIGLQPGLLLTYPGKEADDSFEYVRKPLDCLDRLARFRCR